MLSVIPDTMGGSLGSKSGVSVLPKDTSESDASDTSESQAFQFIDDLSASWDTTFPVTKVDYPLEILI